PFRCDQDTVRALVERVGHVIRDVQTAFTQSRQALVHVFALERQYWATHAAAAVEGQIKVIVDELSARKRLALLLHDDEAERLPEGAGGRKVAWGNDVL